MGRWDVKFVGRWRRRWCTSWKECVALRGVRERYGLFTAVDVMSFGGGDWEGVKAFLEEMWSTRKLLVGGTGG